MITIVDYGMGNLHSVQKGFERLGFPATLTQDAEVISRADGLVFPGQGAFKKAMENLMALGLEKPIRRYLESGKPFLGICLGLQLLFSESEEFGAQRGLDLFKGRVVRFPETPFPDFAKNERLKVPHMGWNRVRMRKASPALEGISEGAHFYFVHSYYPVPEDPGIVATTTDYGVEFVSSVSQGKLFACQFHPEKSQSAGLQILRNFGQLVHS
jgi:imidazole glycerol-phosphate synthase subunit HisH